MGLLKSAKRRIIMPSHPILAAVCAGILGISSAPAAAQSPQPPAPAVRAAMEKLDWLAGEWRGEGWRMSAAGRENFFVAETVEWDVDGLVLVLHGRGWSVGENGEIIEGHKALGILSYDAYARTYRFDAFVKEGYQSRTQPVVGENEYRWSHPAGPGAEMRYHARLTGEGDWFETGERCVSDACTPFLEMRLSKTSAE
jgi:hypothetical protein